MRLKPIWDEALPPSETLELLTRLATHHALQGGDVWGNKIKSLLEQKDYGSLVAFELPLTDPNWDPLKLYHCRQALAFFQKLEDLDIGIDKEEVALKKYHEAEASCKSSNDLFRAVFHGKACLRRGDVLTLESARRKIKHVLGRCPKIRELKLAFGPGATRSIKKKDACPRNKMAARITCSTNLQASGLLPEILRELPHWASAHAVDYTLDPVAEDPVGFISSTHAPRFYEEMWLTEHVEVDVVPAKLSFVAKNAKSYRCTVTEPTLNTVLQKGIGEWMKRRLARAGLDITDQTRNQEFAWLGSVLEGIATLDLSSASDTICYWLVKYLLPADWFSLLNAARTSDVLVRGSVLPLAKFCAMGNGFTFPLETLIFWALTMSQCEGEGSQVGVYGDDIVCPTNRVPAVVKTLNFCGFSVGLEKSFWEGPFRESCGKDYYKGFDVRPYFQKDLVSCETLFTLHNYYFRTKQEEAAANVKSLIPNSLVLLGPDGYGDGHLLTSEFPKHLPQKLREKGYSGYQFETFTSRGRKAVPRYPGDYVSPLYHIYTGGGEQLVPDLEGYGSLRESAPVETLSGRPVWPLPGRSGYKRTKIYALS